MPEPTEPVRPADVARLDIARLRIEDGVPLTAVYERVTETTAQILAVERVGIWLLTPDRKGLRCVDLFERTKPAHTAGLSLRVADFPAYFAALFRRKTLPAEDALADPRTTGLVEPYLQPLGITSMLDAPVWVGGEVVGVVCCEHTGPAREWTTEERDFAGSMADLLAVKMRAAEVAEVRAALGLHAAQAAETGRMRAVADMAAGVAHDLKNMLTVVVGYADMIAADAACSPATASAAREILAAAHRGAGLAAGLMDYARPGPRAVRVIRPAELTTAAASLLQAAAGDNHPVSVTTPPPGGRVFMAADQFERVLMNLVLNARDAMPAGGPIALTVATVDDRDETGRAARFVRVEVADQGEGIPADVLPRIFDPYFSTKPKGQGTGLGLAVVSQAVEFAGGFVRVQSTPGEGSTFQVFLPVVSVGG